MRLVYLDEAGISNIAQEPILTVAGVIVDADRQWKSIEAYLHDLIEKYVPETQGKNFSFHAYELFGGVKFFDKSRWPLERRLEILDSLVEIPRKFDLPICHCSVDRNEAKNAMSEPTSHALLEMSAHAHAFFFCVIQIELFLRSSTSGEFAMLIAENRELVRKMLKTSHSIFKGISEPKFAGMLEDAKTMIGPFGKLLPFERVIEDVHFAEKGRSSLLQLADVCAFAIKRYLMNKPHADRLFKPLQPQFIMGAMPVGLGISEYLKRTRKIN